MARRIGVLLLLLACPVFAAPARTAAQLAGRLSSELGEARAVADLIRFTDAVDRESDLKLWTATLEGVLRTKGARADVRAMAQFLLAQAQTMSGDLTRAHATADALGFVRAFSIVGPFDNDGRRGHEAEFAPETEGLVFGKEYAGKEHAVSWRVLPDLWPLGLVDLTSAISPRLDVTVYAATILPSDKARAVVLHLGTSGATKLWLNGELLRDDKNQHPARLDQAAIPARLSKGDNTLLLKLSHGTGQVALVLRIADEKDEPLPQLARLARAPAQTMEGFTPVKNANDAKAAKAAHQKPLPKPLDALAELTARADKLPKDALAQEDVAIVLQSRRPDDDTERLALAAQEKAAGLAPGDPLIELRLAALNDRDQNKKRQAIERVLARDPREVDALLALMQHRLERSETWKAQELAERAVEAAPSSVLAQLSLARAEDAAGLAGRAAARRLELARKNPEDERALVAGAGALRRLGRGADAKAMLMQALRLRFDDVEARAELVSFALDQGDLEGALARLAEAQALAPASAGLKQRTADLLSQNGRIADANKLYAEVLTLAPDDPDLHEGFGRHKLRSGDPQGALTEFNRALELRPQNPGLRELVRTIKPEERYAAPYLQEVEALAKQARLVPPSPGTDVRILSDETVVKVFSNGLSSRTHQQILQVLTPRGVDQARVQGLQFAPDRQEVRIERARIVRPDGTVIEVKGESDRSLSEPWYGLWYDVHARSVPFTQLQPGDVLEFTSRLDDAGTNFFSDTFGDFLLLQSAIDKLRVEYIVLGPPGRTFVLNHAPLAQLTQAQDTLPDGSTRLRVTALDVPKVLGEPAMPGPSTTYAWLHVSTFKDWESVGRFYWGLVKDQLEVTPEIRRRAAEAVKGVPEGDELARIRAVYHYVLAKTRYVGLEFGINSFKPYPVETILSRGFGDCKDKASTMYALLQALGIDSRVVLLRMRRLGALDPRPASLSVFNHAILYVPKYDLYLDGTAEFHGSKELPQDDHGANALIVEPSGVGSRLVVTPEATPDDNTERAEARIELSADGSAKLSVSTVSQGSWTPELRRTFESPDERKQRAEEGMSRGSYPGLQIASVEVSDPQALEAPFELKIGARMPHFASVNGGGALKFSPFGKRPRNVEAWAQLSSRTQPMELPLAQSMTVVNRVTLPAGYAVKLPDARKAETPFGRWSVRFAQDGDALVATLEQRLNGGILAAKDYGSYRAFLEGLDAAVAQPLEAVQQGGAR
ncbi:MAG: DUF3857 domain-containing protein [Deltaproteobacteria bacterium]|nr:DUF3857 domain-containing protein [Deltaproteobacteria bacterium]